MKEIISKRINKTIRDINSPERVESCSNAAGFKNEFYEIGIAYGFDISSVRMSKSTNKLTFKTAILRTNFTSFFNDETAAELELAKVELLKNLQANIENKDIKNALQRELSDCVKNSLDMNMITTFMSKFNTEYIR